jgi:hypothetical protein
MFSASHSVYQHLASGGDPFNFVFGPAVHADASGLSAGPALVLLVSDTENTSGLCTDRSATISTGAASGYGAAGNTLVAQYLAGSGIEVQVDSVLRWRFDAGSLPPGHLKQQRRIRCHVTGNWIFPGVVHRDLCKSAHPFVVRRPAGMAAYRLGLPDDEHEDVHEWLAYGYSDLGRRLHQLPDTRTRTGHAGTAGHRHPWLDRIHQAQAVVAVRPPGRFTFWLDAASSRHRKVPGIC